MDLCFVVLRCTTRASENKNMDSKAPKTCMKVCFQEYPQVYLYIIFNFVFTLAIIGDSHRYKSINTSNCNIHYFSPFHIELPNSYVQTQFFFSST